MAESYIESNIQNNVLWITLKRDNRLNSINTVMYNTLTQTLQNANDNEKITLTVIKAEGRYYSAGSDFSMDEMCNLSESDETPAYYNFVNAIIEHEKPIVALVQGPAVGIAVTTLGLFDAVIASDAATFWCPFTSLGLCPEAASSYTFIQNMGYTKAAKMLLFAEKLTATEAFNDGLVSTVIPDKNFLQESRNLIDKYSKLSRESLLVSKSLLRQHRKIEKLRDINGAELNALLKQMKSSETIHRLLQKFDKSKL